MNNKATKATKTTRYLACLFVGLGLGLLAHSQEINFKDLTRTGIPVVKRFTVEGVERDGREYLAKFDGVDTDRVDEARSRASSYSSSSSSSSNSSSTSSNSSSATQKSTKTFLCEIYCESALGSRITREVKAANRHEAATYMGDNANEICRGTGFSKASGRSFPDGQCREK
jgi:hypothetical protein